MPSKGGFLLGCCLSPITPTHELSWNAKLPERILRSPIRSPLLIATAVPLAKWDVVKPDPGLWKIAPPEKPSPEEAAGLSKEESAFVSKYLSLADELLKAPGDNSSTEQEPAAAEADAESKAA